MVSQGMQIQFVVPAEFAHQFGETAIEGQPDVHLLSVEQVRDAAVFGFDLAAALEAVNVTVATAAALIGLAPAIRQLLKRGPAPIVVTSPLGKVTLDPQRNLSEDEIRHLLQTLATL